MCRQKSVGEEPKTLHSTDAAYIAITARRTELFYTREVNQLKVMYNVSLERVLVFTVKPHTYLQHHL